MPGTAGRIISNLVNRTKGLDEIHDDVSIIDGIVDVPTKDATADVQMSDVVGKKDDTARTTVATNRSLMSYLKGALNELSTIDTKVDTINTGRLRVFVKSVTSAANAGDVTLATITTHPCIIDSIIIHADTAAQADLTSAAITGGASKVVTFINAADAAKSNIDAIDEQVYWTGAVRLAATKTIIMSLLGTGATAVDLTVIVTYHAEVEGGSLT